MTPGEEEGLVLGDREPLLSVCSCLILSLQRQEAGLDSEPDSEFREILKLDFLVDT